MNELVNGHTNVTLPGRVRLAELADLLRAVTVFRDTSLERVRLEAENTREVEARHQQNRGFNDALQMFEESAEQVLKTVAATGTSQLAENIAGVTNAVEHASQSASAVLAASSQLNEESTHLTAEVKKFIHMLRSGPLDRRKERDASFAGPDRRQRSSS